MSALPAAPELTLPPLSPAIIGRVVAFPGGLGELARRRDSFGAAATAAEAAVERHAYAEVVGIVDAHRSELSTHPDLALRVLFAETRARTYLGDLDGAQSLAEHARAVSELPHFGDVERADALHRLGCVRFQQARVALAAGLFTVALDLCDRTHLPCDALRVSILEWRSRCHQHNRDWDAARADVERALELVEGLDDPVAAGLVYFQGSLVAERLGQWIVARCYGEEARRRFEEAGDELRLARILNNLGGIELLLDNAGAAVPLLEESRARALAVGSAADAAQALSSLAQVLLRAGDPAGAERAAREALTDLDGRADYLDELGNARLVLGRALAAQGRPGEAADAYAEAQDAFTAFGSTSQRAAVWIAQGDLAAGAGDAESAAQLYRTAAEALQDFHF